MAPPAMTANSKVEVDVAARLPWFEEQLKNCADIQFHTCEIGSHPCVFIFIDGLVNQDMLQSHILEPLLLKMQFSSTGEMVAEILQHKLLPVSAIQGMQDVTAALQAIFEGGVLLLIENEPQMVMFPLRATETRAITQSENENVIRGPKQAFVEDLDINVSLIRKIVKNPLLKVEKFKFGSYTNTNVVICYIEGLCQQKLVDEMKERLGRVEIDAILGSSYIEEFIEDNPYSPFPQVQYTERPDIVSAALLEGRIAVIVDGTPIPVIAPVTLYMLLQSPEDYYQRFVAATWIRWIRYLFLLISFLLPSVYIAVTTFHPEMLPPNLLIAVAAARENVPFPAIVEAFIMELTFEALREAGLRIPKPIGQTVSIIGALVIGQAAVQAGIVSAPMVIVVSITGIASFVIPHFDLGLTFRLLRFPVMFLAASLGLYGVILGILLIYLHLVTLRSFGTPYLSPTSPIRFGDWKDVFMRAPIWLMRKRPVLFGTSGGERVAYKPRPQIPEDNGD
ncbi:spore germination protein [Paenibacillus ferrarius]|uniref:spore germination protein n=1 Tax=Paenibacillus ferrarius TaxID=1469647 RepID=UPI003D29A7FD